MPYGMYSARAAELFGTVFWTDKEGNRYEVTAIESDPSRYKWKDSVVVAEVENYAGAGRKGQL